VDNLVIIVFSAVYLGMILGRLPGLALDRTGIALLGAIALFAFGAVQTSEIAAAVDESTMALLFGLMIVSAQFRLSGFYSHVVRRLGGLSLSPEYLLAVLIGLVGVLSAVLVNDIVCLAAAPVLIEVCFRKGYDPKPFLLGLACASNVGSMATLIGNPQNMLIGQVLHLSFGEYLVRTIVPSIMGLAVVWVVIARYAAGRWYLPGPAAEAEATDFNRWQTTKGFLILGGLVGCFLFAPWPRELVAIAAAGVLLCSRRMRSREILGLIDWQLLVLFFGLFLVNYAVKASGDLDRMMAFMQSTGVEPSTPVWLFTLAAVLSNVVSNVPAVMLLLPWATHPLAGPILAYSSTLAGNLLIVGSIANIIVVDQAARMNVKITWREHARVGVPVTIFTLGIAAIWLWSMA
jgi:Na+/H+ antiporter NhaD/arsenite permease-like protein